MAPTAAHRPEARVGYLNLPHTYPTLLARHLPLSGMRRRRT